MLVVRFISCGTPTTTHVAPVLLCLFLTLEPWMWKQLKQSFWNWFKIRKIFYLSLGLLENAANLKPFFPECLVHCLRSSNVRVFLEFMIPWNYRNVKCVWGASHYSSQVLRAADWQEFPRIWEPKVLPRTVYLRLVRTAQHLAPEWPQGTVLANET